MQLVTGGYPITGLADGDAIRLTPAAQQFEMRTGNRGLGSWYKRFNRAFTINVDLDDGSDDNDVLFRFFLFDLHTPGGLMFPLSFIDTAGRTRLISTGARVLTYPEVTIGDGGNIRSWQIGTLKLTGVIGGRASTPVVEYADLPELSELPAVRPAV